MSNFTVNQCLAQATDQNCPVQTINCTSTPFTLFSCRCGNAITCQLNKGLGGAADYLSGCPCTSLEEQLLFSPLILAAIGFSILFVTFIIVATLAMYLRRRDRLARYGGAVMPGGEAQPWTGDIPMATVVYVSNNPEAANVGGNVQPHSSRGHYDV